MWQYLVRRVLILIPMALLVSIIVFFAIRLSPVDPLLYSATPDADMSAGRLDDLRQQLGFNDPLIVQYVAWLGDMLRGEFGYSIQTGRPIGDIYADRLPASLELVIPALILSTIIGVGWGLVSAARPNRIVDHSGRVMSVVGIAVPGFFIAILFVQLFSYKLGWLPASGRIEPGDITFWDRVPNMILPIAALTIDMIAALIRYTRNSALDVMNSEYIKTARSKGISENRVFFFHALRNSLGPVLIVLVFRIPLLVSGAVLVEAVFRWPGIGSVIVSSVSSSDYPVIMVTTMLVAVAILAASFLVDVVKALVDPRVRLS